MFIKTLCEEALILQKLHHVNILPFLGLSLEDSKFLGQDQLPSVVTPWMDNGNLMEYVQKHSTMNRLPLVRYSTFSGLTE